MLIISLTILYSFLTLMIEIFFFIFNRCREFLKKITFKSEDFYIAGLSVSVGFNACIIARYSSF